MLAYTEPFVEVGRIIGFHGYKGEVKVEISGDFIPKSTKMELLFVGFSPASVPFFISNKKQLHDNLWIIQFKNISNEKDAVTLVGKALLLPKSQVKANKAVDENEFELKGYAVIDKKLGKLGTAINITDGVQQLFVVQSPDGSEILIPVVEEFILGINPKTKTIQCSIPEGLLGL